jgi:hypothetical protein
MHASHDLQKVQTLVWVVWQAVAVERPHLRVLPAAVLPGLVLSGLGKWCYFGPMVRGAVSADGSMVHMRDRERSIKAAEG